MPRHGKHMRAFFMGGSDDNASQTAAAAHHHNICAFQGYDHNFRYKFRFFRAMNCTPNSKDRVRDQNSSVFLTYAVSFGALRRRLTMRRAQVGNATSSSRFAALRTSFATDPPRNRRSLKLSERVEHKTEFASGRGVMSGGEKRKRSSRLRGDDERADFGASIVELLAGGTNKDAPVPDTQLLTTSPRVGPESRRSGKRTSGAEVLWSC